MAYLVCHSLQRFHCFLKKYDSNWNSYLLQTLLKISRNLYFLETKTFPLWLFLYNKRTLKRNDVLKYTKVLLIYTLVLLFRLCHLSLRT